MMSRQSSIIEHYLKIQKDVRKKSTRHRNFYYTHSQHRNIKFLHERYPEPKAEIGLKTAEKYGIKNGVSYTINLLTDTPVREPIMGYPQMKSLLCAIGKA